jgi:hypothetical protein
MTDAEKELRIAAMMAVFRHVGERAAAEFAVNLDLAVDGLSQNNQKLADAFQAVIKPGDGLRKWHVQRDKFEPDETGARYFSFPCCVCLHNEKSDKDEPCRTCDHNAGAVKDEPDVCPDCGRRKAISLADAVAGACPRWWSPRCDNAEADCQRVAAGRQRKD